MAARSVSICRSPLVSSRYDTNVFMREHHLKHTGLFLDTLFNTTDLCSLTVQQVFSEIIITSCSCKVHILLFLTSKRQYATSLLSPDTFTCSDLRGSSSLYRAVSNLLISCFHFPFIVDLIGSISLYLTWALWQYTMWLYSVISRLIQKAFHFIALCHFIV